MDSSTDTRHPWAGLATSGRGSRRRHQQRNRMIFDLAQKGETAGSLAYTFELSVERIQQIVGNVSRETGIDSAFLHRNKYAERDEQIFKLYQKPDFPMSEIVRIFGLTPKSIYNIVHRYSAGQGLPDPIADKRGRGIGNFTRLTNTTASVRPTRQDARVEREPHRQIIARERGFIDAQTPTAV